jgi:DNA invertase Pin-like site-specific DNA recombinase
MVLRLVDREAAAPALRRLLAAARRNAFDVVVVETINSLARSPAGVLRVAAKLEHAGVRILSPREPWFDTNGAAERWMLKGELRRQHRAAKTLKAKREYGERTGEIPYGFRLAVDGISLEPDEREQQVIAQARRLSSEGYSFRVIAQSLSNWGYLSRANTAFGHRQIARMVRRGLAA